MLFFWRIYCTPLFVPRFHCLALFRCSVAFSVLGYRSRSTWPAARCVAELVQSIRKGLELDPADGDQAPIMSLSVDTFRTIVVVVYYTIRGNVDLAAAWQWQQPRSSERVRQIEIRTLAYFPTQNSCVACKNGNKHVQFP
jgi:hypothetical protein